MRRQRRRYNRRRGRGWTWSGHGTKLERFKRFALFFCCLAIFVASVTFAVDVVRPSLIAVAELQVQTMVTRSINQAVADEFLQGDTHGELIQVQTASDGEVTMIRADTLAMNQMAASLTSRIQDKITNLGEDSVPVPLGSVFGSQILSQIGPSMELRVIPIGTAEVGFKTEFESSGINQTRHRIYLEVNSTARILAPFSLGKIELHDVVLVAETVIVGDVPQSYVFVPEQSILDGMDSGSAETEGN